MQRSNKELVKDATNALNDCGDCFDCASAISRAIRFVSLIEVQGYSEEKRQRVLSWLRSALAYKTWKKRLPLIQEAKWTVNDYEDNEQVGTCDAEEAV
jgi:hypothetical protein